MTDLDTLLSAPLASVEDAGFSSRIFSQVTQQQTTQHRGREIAEGVVLLIAACLFLLAVPLPALNSAIEYLTLNLSSSLPVGLAVGILVLTTTYLRSTEQS